jgi:hypothetical protein
VTLNLFKDRPFRLVKEPLLLKKFEPPSFFGTGGGQYNFKDGTYTEHIEFFSRDATRVGASLSFKAEINKGEWHHSGLSSKGEKIHEVWSRK